MFIPRNKYGYLCSVTPGLLRRGLGIDCLQAHQAEQTGHSFSFHRITLGIEPCCHLARSIEWRSGVLLIEQSHQMQILLAFWHRFIIVAGSSKTKQLTLLSNT